MRSCTWPHASLVSVVRMISRISTAACIFSLNWVSSGLNPTRVFLCDLGVGNAWSEELSVGLHGLTKMMILRFWFMMIFHRIWCKAWITVLTILYIFQPRSSEWIESYLKSFRVTKKIYLQVRSWGFISVVEIWPSSDELSVGLHGLTINDDKTLLISASVSA